MSEIVLLSREAEVTAAVRRTATLDSRLSGLSTAQDIAELGAQLNGASVALALLDLGPDPIDTLRRAEPLVRRHPQTQFVALCAELAGPIVLEAMQVGARGCIEKTRIADDLPTTIDRLLGGAAARSGGGPGQVIVVLSAKGGCGATSLALQLAEEMRGEAEALLVDLDEGFGGLSHALGARGSFGVADVLERGSGVDAELVRSTAQEAGSGLLLLSSPASTSEGHAARLSIDTPGPFFEACREGYPVTVVDAGRPTSRAAVALAAASDATLLVFQLSVVDLKSARHLLRILEEEHAPTDGPHLVANRVRKRGGLLTLADARETLGDRELCTIANDYEGMAKSLDLGKPLARLSPRSPARRDVQRLADLLRPAHLRGSSAPPRHSISKKR